MKIKRMFAAARKSSTLELFVYDVIGGDFFGEGITPAAVQEAIKEAGDFSSITVHLNSPGGASFDGVAIYNILRQQNVPVNVIVEGLAASAAFTVAMAGDKISIGDGAMMMLHNAWSMAVGDSKEMRATADLLDKVSGTMRDMYAKRSGLPMNEVAVMMDVETWLTGQEAITFGFADELLVTTPQRSKEAAALVAKFDLSKFCANVPDKLKNAAPECMCDCPECQAGDCANCSDPDCEDPNCNDGDGDEMMKAAEVRSRRLKLAEIQQPKV